MCFNRHQSGIPPLIESRREVIAINFLIVFYIFCVHFFSKQHFKKRKIKKKKRIFDYATEVYS